jgi:phosphotransferase system HPr-like phosphotransfer protein
VCASYLTYLHTKNDRPHSTPRNPAFQCPAWPHSAQAGKSENPSLYYLPMSLDPLQKGRAARAAGASHRDFKLSSLSDFSLLDAMPVSALTGVWTAAARVTVKCGIGITRDTAQDIARALKYCPQTEAYVVLRDRAASCSVEYALVRLAAAAGDEVRIYARGPYASHAVDSVKDILSAAEPAEVCNTPRHKQ